MGIMSLSRRKGRHSVHESEESNPKHRAKDLENRSSTQRRKLEIAYRQCLRKKTKRLGSETSQEIAQAVTELRQEFKVSLDYIFTVLAQNKDLPLIARKYFTTTLSSLKISLRERNQVSYPE